MDLKFIYLFEHGMGKGHGWFGLRRDSSGGKSQAPQFPDDPNDEQLCGVGVVLYKAPDNSLFVKVRTPARSQPRLAPGFASPAERAAAVLRALLPTAKTAHRACAWHKGQWI